MKSRQALQWLTPAASAKVLQARNQQEALAHTSGDFSKGSSPRSPGPHGTRLTKLRQLFLRQS